MTRKSSRIQARQGHHKSTNPSHGVGVSPGAAPPPPPGDPPSTNNGVTASVPPTSLPGDSWSTDTLPRSFAEVAAADSLSPVSGATPLSWDVIHAGDRHCVQSPPQQHSPSALSNASRVYDVLDVSSDEEKSNEANSKGGEMSIGGNASGSRAHMPSPVTTTPEARPNNQSSSSGTDAAALPTRDSPASSPSDPISFGSPAFNAILSQLQSVTRVASARWDLMDRNHWEYMAHFQATDTSMEATSLITSKMATQVHELRMAVQTTSMMASEARDLARSGQAESSSLRQLVDALSQRVSLLDPSDSTVRIGECFAAADSALQAAVDDFQGALSSKSSPSSSPSGSGTPGLDDTPTSTPNRHPRFSNVHPRYHDAEYTTDSEAAFANARRTQIQLDALAASPVHPQRYPDPDDDIPNSEAAQDGGRVTSPGRDFEYFHDRDRIPSYLGDHDAPSSPPSSPTHRASLLHGLPPHILAWHAGRARSLGDPLTGTHIMEPPDVELLGIDTALSVTLVEYHYDLVQNWENPRWIKADSRRFGNSGFGPFSSPSTSGPNITEIQKQLASWDKLTDLSPAGWQIFYNKLRRGCKQWKIALMPFEAINLKYECQGHGLCVCGLGITWWKKMGDALFTVLEYLLPTSNAIIYTTMTSLANVPSSSPNGYELLWILLKEFIPMFDTTQPAPLPAWPTSGDIFEFGRLVLMYCDLARHRSSVFTEAMKSRLFLSHVKGDYTQLAQPYLALVNTYCPGRDGIVRCSDPLPHHLTVLELPAVSMMHGHTFTLPGRLRHLLDLMPMLLIPLCFPLRVLRLFIMVVVTGDH
jgi:hypothetical protein